MSEIDRESFRRHLQQVILPFWKELKDDVHGGYVGYVGFDLKPDPSSVKGCILNSRILWFFSTCEQALGDRELRPYADHAFEMLKRFVDEEHGGLYWSLTPGGTVKDGTKHTYNQAFGVYALSAYYTASKNREALALCRALFDVIETKCRDEMGYLEAFDASFRPVANEKLSKNGVMALRTMNTLLHLLEAYTAFLEGTGDAAVRERLRQIVVTLLDKVYNPAQRRLEVFFDLAYNSLLDLNSYGHDIEASWLMEHALLVLKDRELDRKAAPVLHEMVAHVYEDAFKEGCLYNECERGRADRTRVWWVQAEAVAGFLHAAWREGNPAYLAAAKEIWQYIQDHLVDRRAGGEWFWSLDEGGRPIEKPIVEPWKCPYHNGRMCMEAMRVATLFR